MLPEPNRRVRWITYEEVDRLIAALPIHLVPVVKFSLETGLRRSNVTGLQWSQIDLARRTAWIHPDQAKTRKAIAVSDISRFKVRYYSDPFPHFEPRGETR
jgi:integrase